MRNKSPPLPSAKKFFRGRSLTASGAVPRPIFRLTIPESLVIMRLAIRAQRTRAKIIN